MSVGLHHRRLASPPFPAAPVMSSSVRTSPKALREDRSPTVQLLRCRGSYSGLKKPITLGRICSILSCLMVVPRTQRVS